MQKTARGDGVGAGAVYRERLSPSLWVLAAAAVLAPMAGLVLTPIDQTVALVAGVAVGILAVVALVAGSPVVEIRDGMLRAGRARIPVDLLGEPAPLTGDAARTARSVGLDARGWHTIRGGIDGIVVLPVIDPDDPTPTWTVSSRTPDRLAAAVRRTQTTRRTPGR